MPAATRVLLYLYGPFPFIRTPSGIPRLFPSSRVFLKSYKTHKAQLNFSQESNQRLFFNHSGRWTSYRMVPSVPIPNEERNIPIRQVKGNRDHSTIIHSDAAKAAGSTLELERREVEEATNLILHLKLVSPVPSRRNRAVRSQNSILPWVLPMLDPIPAQKHPFTIKIKAKLKEIQSKKPLPSDEQWFVEGVEHIDNHVPVGGDIHHRTRKLLVNGDHLPKIHPKPPWETKTKLF